MDVHRKFYIDGQWVTPNSPATAEVINPCTENSCATIAMGDTGDVDRAVAAAVAAFESFSLSSVDQRISLLERISECYEKRFDEFAEVVSMEMGAPISLCESAQVPAGIGHLRATVEALREFAFTGVAGTTEIRHEPIGVCALITPWNWPLNQITAKVAPALATGCTMVLKPSEVAPLSAMVFASVLDDAGVPPGVFNLVNGDGPTVGAALARHRDVAMVSFTGSTRAGVEVARNAASTVKRVSQELGGKSANIVLDDADLEAVIRREVPAVYVNSGQSCNASTRILVRRDLMDQAAAVARSVTEGVVVGPPSHSATQVGPLVSQAQFDKVQELIRSGVDEGATLVSGGLGRPEGLSEGYYARPTVFSNVTPQMRIANEEIFGPVVTIMGYSDDEEAVQLANASEYGLSGMVNSADTDRARAVAARLRTGMVHINGAPLDNSAPFGGYKQSGNGREFGAHGLHEFLETKSIYAGPETRA